MSGVSTFLIWEGNEREGGVLTTSQGHLWGEDPRPCLWETWNLPLTSGVILGFRDSDPVSRGRVVLAAHV